MAEVTNKLIDENKNAAPATTTACVGVALPSNTASISRVSKKSNPKKKKNRCYFHKCSSTSLKFIGDCQFCEGHFCSRHRLLENHACQGLKSCKEQMHQRNAEKLESEQTIVPKIQI